MSRIYKPLSLSVLALTLCNSFPSFAASEAAMETVSLMQQDGKATGTVNDVMGPIIGATVLVKGTQNGTVTDFDGHFSLENVKSGSTLVISYIGYVTKEVKYSGQPITVNLEEDNTQLSEVVVTGYGGVQKAKTMTAAAVAVPVKTIAKLPVVSLGEGLGGRVTGVTTQQSSGAPGESTKIWVRGGSDVLYVIDDVVMETEQGEQFFSRLRPSDIASMTILKDASATAVYGPRASDGVVVVQTKRGQEGQVEITVEQKVSIMTPSYRPKVMNSYDYAKTLNDLYAASYQTNPAYNNTELSKYYMGYLWQKGVSQQDMAGLVNKEYGMNYSLQDIQNLFDARYTQGGNIQDYYSTYDPWDMFDHVQPMYQTNVSARGGSDRLKYYSSLGYLNQQGISPIYGYEQINLILNTDSYLLSDKSLKFTLNVNGNIASKERPAAGESVFTDAMYGSIMPTRPAQWSTGLRRAGSVESLLNTGFNNTKSYSFQTNMGLKYNLPWVEGLSASANVHFNTNYSMNKQFNHDQVGVYSSPVAAAENAFNSDNANVYQYWSNYLLTTGIFQIDYAKSIGKHNFNAMVNYQSQVRNTNFTSAKRKGYPTTFVEQVENGATIVDAKGGEGKWGSSSYIGRISYDYAGKYMAQFNVNTNGSLNYSKDKRWGTFPSASVGWLMSEENFFKENVNPEFISSAKIRGGFGIVGAEVGSAFQYINQYAQSGDRLLLGTNMDQNVGWYESNVANDLTWSKSQQWNGGLDVSFLNNRLEANFDTFLYLNSGSAMDMNQEEIRTDILGMPNTPQINADFETSRKGGFEIALKWQDKIADFSYHVGVNYSYWDERITRHTSQDTDWYYKNLNNLGKRTTSDAVYAWSWQTKPGLFSSFDQMYNSYLHMTRNQSPGTFIMDDVNGDGVLNYGDYVYNNFPGSVPLTLAGLTLGGNYKGFDFELFFQGATNVTGATPSPLRSQQSYMWKYGQYAFSSSYLPSNPNTDASLPIPVGEGNGWGYNMVDRWQFDASYIKLKNISVRYDLKNQLLKNLKYIQGLELSFVATNVFTLTKDSYPLKGFCDPEFITTGSSIYATGGTLGSYPVQRGYTFGVTVTL
ncbi:MAG: SusC/RagA family TonB-linked outer membrane protein [Bacteroidales bacterium]|nr:SusC/RagA family TonB-linked outer membrane protein [Bacteroidales bacterium]